MLIISFVSYCRFTITWSIQFCHFWEAEEKLKKKCESFFCNGFWVEKSIKLYGKKLLKAFKKFTSYMILSWLSIGHKSNNSSACLLLPFLGYADSSLCQIAYCQKKENFMNQTEINSPVQRSRREFKHSRFFSQFAIDFDWVSNS
jgi:hypothetical protein